MSKSRAAIVIGGGGHARVLMDLLHLCQWNVIGYTDNRPGQPGVFGVPFLGGDDIVARWHPRDVVLVNGIGSVGLPEARSRVFEEFKCQGYVFPSVVHPTAVVSPHAVLEAGAQVMAGAVVQAGCRIGENVIVNTRASIDHDCDIEAHAHVAPGAVLSGCVHVGERAHIGAGATVIQGLTIGAGAIVGAGAVVVDGIPDGVTVVGVPARILRPARMPTCPHLH